MTELPEIAKRAMRLHTATVTDLSLFGGVLRCEECDAERSLGDVAGHLRAGWPEHCGKTMTWVTLKQLAAERWGEIPDGYWLVAVPDENWRIETGKRCRRQGPRGKVCGKPSVASLNRPRRVRATDCRSERLADSFWPYCIDHLYSRWIGDGQVMHWVLRKTGGPGA